MAQTKDMYSKEIDILLDHLKQDTLMPIETVENLSKNVKDVVQKHNDIIEDTFSQYLSKVTTPQATCAASNRVQ